MTSRYPEMPAQKTSVETVAFSVGSCALGRILVGTTAQGICAILLGNEERSLGGQLRSIFPKARLQKASQELDEMLDQIVQFIEMPTGILDLPLDMRGTTLQKQVWNALSEIPPGRTATYKELASKLGATAQEIGEACAANKFAVVIPCHRVVRSDGGLAGYRWGMHRKRLLLQREQELFPDPESLFAVR